MSTLPIKGIIFSKDRAMQLHGLLSSYGCRCGDADQIPVSVIYRASTPAYRQAYELLKEDFKGNLTIHWIKETDFKKNILENALGQKRRNWLERLLFRPSRTDEKILFLVDDNLFVQDFHFAEVARALSNHRRALGFSLRLGKNTNYCYPNRAGQSLPALQEDEGGILRFTWPDQEGDFGYPLEVSSSVYRREDIEGLLQRLPYANPNRLEQGLSVSSRLFARRKPELLCFEKSVAFCAPVNKVQSSLENRAGEKTENSAESLNAAFLNGYRIDVEALRGFVPRAAHQEIELPLVRLGA